MDGQSRMTSRRLKVFSALLLVLTVSLLALPLATAQGDPGGEFVEPFKVAFNTIIDIFKLDWLEGQGIDTYAAVVRFALWLVTFTIIHEILTKFHYFSAKSSKVIALAFSVMAAVFMPQTMLIAIGESYAALFGMIFIGAIVFAGWRLGHWIESQGGPGSRPMFIIIMLVLMWLVWLIQVELAEERKVPGMEWGIFGTVYNWFGTIALIALGYTLVTKGFFGGGGGAAAGGGLFGGGGDTGAGGGKAGKKAAAEKAHTLKEEEDLVKEDKELEEETKTQINMNEIVGKLQMMRGNLDKNALGVLKELEAILPSLAEAARQVQAGAGDEEYHKLLTTAIGLVHQIVAILSQEKKLEAQAEEAVKKQIWVARKVYQEHLKVWRKEHAGHFISAARKLKGTNYEKELKKLSDEGTALRKRLRELINNEEHIIHGLHGQINDELNQLRHFERLLEDIKNDPKPQRIIEGLGELHKIVSQMNERLQRELSMIRVVTDNSGNRIELHEEGAAIESALRQLVAMNWRLQQIIRDAEKGQQSAP